MGIQRCAGYKLGAWHDVAWLRKVVGSFEGAPGARVPLGSLDAVAVREVLDAAEAAMNVEDAGAGRGVV